MDSPVQGRNLAGIIPLSGQDNKFDWPWPDYMQPLQPGTLAIDRSVLECAVAGCDSIWIVCNDDTAPLVKKRIGDYVMSPRYFEEKDFVKRKDYHQRWIPVYYTPVSQKDRDRRDSLGWSVLHGALTAFSVANKISRWTLPNKYFVSFPYGIYNTEIIKKNRSLIRGPESFCLSHENKTIKDNLFLSFTFFPEDWLLIKKNIKNQCTGGSKSIPAPERWSSRNFKLDKIFNLDIIGKDQKIEVENYYNLTDWSSLQEFYASKQKITKLSKLFVKPYYLKEEQ